MPKGSVRFWVWTWARSEDGAWLAFLRSLTARGLSGVELVTSDAHQGLKNAKAAMPHPLMANLLTRVRGVATMVRTIYQHLPPRSTASWRVVEQR